MLGAVGGSLLLLFGLVIVGYTIYKMITNTPVTVVDWVFESFYLLAGLIVAYYGFQTLYPPVPLGFAGIGARRRR